MLYLHKIRIIRRMSQQPVAYILIVDDSPYNRKYLGEDYSPSDHAYRGLAPRSGLQSLNDAYFPSPKYRGIVAKESG